jgi:hypothetical protein
MPIACLTRPARRGYCSRRSSSTVIGSAKRRDLLI